VNRRPLRATHEIISHPRRNHLETEPFDSGSVEHGDANMLFLMNLIWRRLAYTVLIGMRSKLVRQ